MSRPLPDPSLPWPIPLEAVAEIAESEGLELVAYRCPAGIWTIGWGETDGVHPGDTCTKLQADAWLLEDLQGRVQEVQAMCTAPTSPNELGALTSLAYNIGVAGLRKSTVLRCHNAGTKQAAARAFDLWNKAKDPSTGQLRELAGLTARRKREAALYLKPAPGQRVEPMPQAVEAESSPIRGPIASGGAAISVAGVVSAASLAGEGLGAVSPVLKQAREILVDLLGVPTEWLLPAAAIGLGVLVVRWRLKQRTEGWA